MTVFSAVMEFEVGGGQITKILLNFVKRVKKVHYGVLYNTLGLYKIQKCFLNMWISEYNVKCKFLNLTLISTDTLLLRLEVILRVL